MTGSLDRTLLLCVAFALVADPSLATTVPDSRGAWTKARVPIELRTRVHTSVSEVPTFPEDDPKLALLKNWPKRRTIEGWSCELQVTEACNTGSPSTMVTSAYYLCRPRWWPWGRPQMRGPHFTWTSGHLLERGFTTSANHRVVYQVDRAGRLAGFHDKTFGTIEYFDVDGVLIAGEYMPVNLDWRSEGYRGGTVSVWLGERVSHDEFIRRLRKHNQETAWRY
jgi:hypothetical protein